MNGSHSGRGPVVAGVILAICGLALAVGGVWLLALGGTWFYVAAAILFLLTAWLLFERRAEALLAYALLVLATLAWALLEAGFDWWPLAARGDVVFLIGLFLLTPFVARGLGHRDVRAAMDREKTHPSAFRGTGIALTVSLALALGVGIVSWLADPHRIEGTLPAARAELPGDAGTIPPGEWHAYGRTGFGQRYSPLEQITPENVSRLQVAWEYHTGDERQPSDPTETTFEVTPLKIGDRLYLCTPHQFVIALDATTGEEIWRFDPKIESELALQHLTCRGLSYQPPADAGTAAGTTPAAAAASEPAGEAESAAAPTAGSQTAPATPSGPPGLDLPVAGANAPTTECRGKLFMPTADGRLIALDLETGRVCASFGGGDGQINLWTNMPYVNPGSYYSTSPVVVTDDLVIVGGTVLDNVSTTQPSGVIRAFDVETGALVWNWDSGNPDETGPLEPGETYTPNSPNSWSISSVDEELGLVYVPLGNQPPDQWGGNRSPAVERFSSSVVALDLATGELAWVFQTVHHDLWDYDVPSQPSLVDLNIGSEVVPALVQPTKQGGIYVLDRRTGEPILPVTERPVPQGTVPSDHAAPTQPVSELSFNPPQLAGSDMWGVTMFDQLACRIAFRQLRYEGRYTPPSLQGTLVYPGNFGVFNWGSIAVDPKRQVAFTTPTYLAFVSRLVPREDPDALYVHDSGPPQGALPALNENFGAPYAVELYAFLSFLGIPCQEPPWGYVAGVDLTTGEVAWMHKNGTVRDMSPIPLPLKMGVPNLGGPIMTAGGVAFLSSTLDYFLRAYDVTTGEQLWESRLPAGGQATPMTYLGRDGRQYVVVAAGGHGSLGTKAGDAVIAYALPEAVLADASSPAEGGGSRQP